MAKTFEQECKEGWFEFNPDRSFEERCEIVRRTGLSDKKIVPLDELKRRVQEKMKENIDNVFQQLKNHEQEIISPPADA